MTDLSVPLHRRALIRAGIAVSSAGALPSVALAAAPDRKRQVVALLGSIATTNLAPAAVIDPHRYTQYNLTVADGPAGFRAMIAGLKPGAMPVETVRVFADGDHVVAHSRYGAGPTPTIGFDVFRFAGDRIVLH